MIEFSQQEQYQVMHGVLNERQWRLYVATEAKRRGTGGISQVAREAGVTRKTIRKGLQELEAGERYEPGGRIRRKGGGRKQAIVKDKTLSTDLEALLEPKGDPQSLVQWTTKAMSKLKEALKSQGHTIGETAIRELLKGMGFSLKATKKTIEGTVHADRDAQFQQINRTGKAFEAAGKPMISVDCKKKELKRVTHARVSNDGQAVRAKLSMDCSFAWPLQYIPNIILHAFSCISGKTGCQFEYIVWFRHRETFHSFIFTSQLFCDIYCYTFVL